MDDGSRNRSYQLPITSGGSRSKKRVVRSPTWFSSGCASTYRSSSMPAGPTRPLAATAIISGGVAEKHPELRLAFSHAAGGFPLMLTRAQWFWGRTWNEEPPLPEDARPEAAPWFAEHGPIELARRFYYDSLVFDRRAIRYLIDMLGADRLLVGSDFPAMPREDPIAKTLRSMGLSDAESQDILWHNCFRFLGVEPPKLSSVP